MTKTGFQVMTKLLVLVKPFSGIMFITIIMGVLGFLSAIGITVIGSVGLLHILNIEIFSLSKGLVTLYILLAILALSRGILRYLEQSSGHYIAFKLLAFIRDKVFKSLRRLAPSKTDAKDSGQLIALITSDIELLEVFYAHTIAPIIIAIITSLIMTRLIFSYSPILAGIALIAYLMIGGLIPYLTAKRSRHFGREYRENVGELNHYFLESLRGMREIMLFNGMTDRHNGIQSRSILADQSTEKIRSHEGITKAITETALLSFSALMLFVGLILYQKGYVSFEGFILSLVILMSSYGPVVALSNLSNNLLQTLASGERVLDLLSELPQTQEVTKGESITTPSIDISHVNFTYQTTPILKDLSLHLEPGKILGICGPSGCGKSTLLKLLMHFYESQGGSVSIGGNSVSCIVTKHLREQIAYVTQDTYLFDSTIEENLRIAKRNATTEELIAACQKASIYDFIQSLPQGLQTKVGELGDSLSGGERQRIGIARAFLHDSPIILLDEPTSNLDSLNESVILHSLKAHCKDKTIILVSHRHSTMSIADEIHYMTID